MGGSSSGIGAGSIWKSGSSSWTPAKPLGGETPNLWITSRNGLNMIDTIAAENPVITLPSVQQSNNPLIVADNGGLDIGASAGDFTFAVRCKSNSTVKTSYPTIGGKGVDGSVNGMYYFYQNITTGKIHWLFKSTGTVKDTEVNLDFTGAGWILLLLEIDKTALVGRCFINGVQVGADVAYTGTFPLMANAYEFMLGKANNAAGSGTNYNINAIFSEAWVYNRKLTPTEKTTITNFGHITDLTGERAHWVCNNITPRDLSGNGYHLATITGDATNTSIIYDSSGSRYLLDKGYSLYKYSGSSILQDKYVGYKGDGTTLDTPSLVAGYAKVSDHPGNLTQHNLADSYLTFVGANWDRSDVTIFGDMARQTALMTGSSFPYIVATPKAWHITDLNRVKMNTFFLSAYKGIAYPKITNNSVDDRQVLTEIFGYATNKTGLDYTKAITYTEDHGHSWDISYFFSDTHYCTTRGNKILAYDGNTTFSLSLDGGATFPITKSVTGYSGNVCQMAWITAVGNIYFGSKTKMYYSFDNLATVTEMTVQAVGGGAYTFGTNANFTRVNPAANMTFGGVEALIWGNYTITADTDYTQAQVWQLIDGATVLRSIYNYTAPSLVARHTENVFQASDESVYIQTGDGNGYINIIKGVCNNLATYNWTFSSISPANTNEGFWHWAGGSFYNGYLYVSAENTPHSGIWRALYTDDLTLEASYKKLNSFPTDILINLIGVEGKLIASEAEIKNLGISNNGLDIYLFRIIGGVDLAVFEGGYFGFDPPNTEGYFMGQILADGETWENPTIGQVIMLKIVEE